jgi:cyclophilin family peptidyl-prolyl cis-trans isomerase
VRGTVGMARASDPNSGNSQFFIMFADGPQLNGQYTVFGKVVSGMNFADAIKRGDPNNNGMVTDPDHIISAKIVNE